MADAKFADREDELKGFEKEWKELKLCKIADIKKGDQLNKIELEKEDESPAINGGISPSW